MDWSDYFQLGPVSPDTVSGHYTISLVVLSYFMASLASFVALDFAGRLRKGSEEFGSRVGLLIGGAVSMGLGIWTMHFIGMLAFVMPMPMAFDSVKTINSMILAVVASAFAFYLIKDDRTKGLPLVAGGILLGLGIVSMHYMGMSAMLDVKIRYWPGLFALSILIALVTSEVALWLMIKGSEISERYRSLMKIGSSLVMGLAICGMHYTGMAAAVFTDTMQMDMMDAMHAEPSLNPNTMSIYLAATTILIISIALIASRSWMKALQVKNKKLLETEAILEQKSIELQKLVEQSISREEKISAILTAAADGIIVMDEKGCIELCNRAVREMLEYEDDAIISHSITSFVGKFDAIKNEFVPLSLDELLVEKELFHEFAGLRKDHTIVPLELNMALSTIHNENLYIVVLHDITKRKQADEQVNRLNKQLLDAARKAGMAEVAIGVLHNVGNVLNSINITAQTLIQRSRNSMVPGLTKFADLLQEQRNQLEQFIKHDPRGQMLPEYLQQFAEYWNKEQTYIDDELESLNEKVQHIKQIVLMQQMLSKSSGIVEKVQLNKLLDDALALHDDILEKNEIKVVREYGNTPVISVDKTKVMQILVNLVKNSLEAVIESDKEEKIITLRTTLGADSFLHIVISDNGIGIEQNNLKNIFSFGFTTKKIGHGYGLHTSAVAAQQEGGSLNAYSLGANQGASFELKLPLETKILAGGKND